MFMFHSEAIWSATKYCGSSPLSVTSIVNDKYDVDNYIIVYPEFLKVDEMRWTKKICSYIIHYLHS